jgi:DNA polymerase bacteriophage-type
MMTARPGFDLMAGDYSAIEARALNWLAGRDDVVESFRKYDAGDKSQDPYKRMAVRMGRAATVEEVTYVGRQAGKAAELGCGYQMGWSKFISAAWQVYQVRVDETEAKAAVAIYRESHQKVQQLWWGVEKAAKDATREPGVVKAAGIAGNIRFIHKGGYLYCILPSGRPLCYPQPKLVDGVTPWGEHREQLEYSSIDTFTKRWSRQRTYGGHLVENIVQAVSRDLLAEALLRAEAAGYLPLLSVHDEAIVEVPKGFGSVEAFEQLMSEVPAWAVGCPVAAEAWRGERYRK